MCDVVSVLLKGVPAGGCRGAIEKFAGRKVEGASADSVEDLHSGWEGIVAATADVKHDGVHRIVGSDVEFDAPRRPKADRGDRSVECQSVGVGRWQQRLPAAAARSRLSSLRPASRCVRGQSTSSYAFV
jgi:hypothetical protein